jgi:NAD+ diphosphatase
MNVSRAVFDRAGALRDEPGLLDTLRSSAETRVIVVREGRARVAHDALVAVSPAEVEDTAEWALLGRDGQGRPVLAAVAEPQNDSIDAAPDESWLGVRDTGGMLDAENLETMVAAVTVASWLRDARFCPRCGTEASLRQTGWSRHCDVCDMDIFPRTDPAVIVTVESSDGERLLLGANANWRGRMYSCFAGFVEAGESLEMTVHRELEEEAGVLLDEVRYISSQPWPYPRSLMIGFRATASDEQEARPDGEEIIDVRWCTREEIGSALKGEGPIGLPGPASIARALIIDWYEDQGRTAPTMDAGPQ